MADSNNKKRIRREAASANASASSPNQTANSVQTPVPQTDASESFDFEAPTILPLESGVDADVILCD